MVEEGSEWRLVFVGFAGAAMFAAFFIKFPKPQLVKRTLPVDTGLALNEMYNELLGQYYATSQRFGAGIKLAVGLSSLGIIAAGVAEVLAPMDAGKWFVMIGFVEIAAIYAIWTINDWRANK
jgi:hypothetical protein